MRGLAIWLYDTYQAAFGALLNALLVLGESWALVLISLVAGAALVLLYKHVSAQALIARTKRDIAANILESVLFRHDLKVCLGAQMRALGLSIKYAALAVPALVILAIPALLVMGQLYPYFGLKRLQAGEDVVVIAHVRDAADAKDLNLELMGAESATPPVRIGSEEQVTWRVKAGDSDEQSLQLKTGELQVTLPLNVASSAAVSGLDRWPLAWLTGARALSAEFAHHVRSVEVRYSARDIQWLGLQWNWIVLFFVVSLAGGLLAGKIAKVEL